MSVAHNIKRDVRDSGASHIRKETINVLKLAK
jgi:hypothetical protein